MDYTARLRSVVSLHARVADDFGRPFVITQLLTDAQNELSRIQNGGSADDERAEMFRRRWIRSQVLPQWLDLNKKFTRYKKKVVDRFDKELPVYHRLLQGHLTTVEEHKSVLIQWLDVPWDDPDNEHDFSNAMFRTNEVIDSAAEALDKLQRRIRRILKRISTFGT